MFIFGRQFLCCIIGAGKTFTMLGNEKNLGMMPRTLNDLFIKIQQNKNEFIYDVRMSYLEVCKEKSSNKPEQYKLT